MYTYEFVAPRRANAFGEWVVRCYIVINGKVLRAPDGDYFGDSREDANASCVALEASEAKRRESMMPEYSI